MADTFSAGFTGGFSAVDRFFSDKAAGERQARLDAFNQKLATRKLDLADRQFGLQERQLGFQVSQAEKAQVRKIFEQASKLRDDTIKQLREISQQTGKLPPSAIALAQRSHQTAQATGLLLGIELGDLDVEGMTRAFATPGTEAANAAAREGATTAARSNARIGAAKKSVGDLSREEKLALLGGGGGTNVVVNTGQTQEKAEAKAVGGEAGAQFNSLQKQSLSAFEQNTQLEALDSLLGRLETGPGAGAKNKLARFAAALGVQVDTEKLGAAEAAEAITAEMVLQARNPESGGGLPGNTSNRDLEFLQSLNPTIATTKEGRQFIIEVQRKRNERKIEIARLAREFRTENGQFTFDFIDQLQAFAEANPVFSEDDRARLANLLGSVDAVLTVDDVQEMTLEELNSLDLGKLNDQTLAAAAKRFEELRGQ